MNYKTWWTDRKGEVVGNVSTIKRELLLVNCIKEFVLTPFDDITLHIEKVD